MKRVLHEVRVFAYVNATNASTYRAIMQAFYAAKQRYVIELRPEAVLNALKNGPYAVESEVIESKEVLERYLAALVKWGNLSHAHDTAAVSRIADFEQKRYIYHLSAVGEVAHRAVLEVESTIGKSGSLQSTMLWKIRDALFDIADQVGREGVDANRILALLHNLESAFDTLTEEANRFMAELAAQAHLAVDDPDGREAQFSLRKQAVLNYISRFIEQLHLVKDEIATGIQAVCASGVERVLEIAGGSADIPPSMDGSDPVEAWKAERRAKWEGIELWFVRREGQDYPTIGRLAEVAVESVVALTRALSRMNELRGRAVDRAADFRALASWFSLLADDGEAHRLWRNAFGLQSCRHFHLTPPDEEIAQPSRSWWDSSPVRVPVRLGTRGRVSGAGRPAGVPDHAKAKALIAERRRKEREDFERALDFLVSRSPFRIGDLAQCDRTQLNTLLWLLDEAMSGPREENGAKSAVTADGRFRVRFSPSAGGKNSTIARIVTPDGIMSCENHILEVTRLRARLAPIREAAEEVLAT